MSKKKLTVSEVKKATGKYKERISVEVNGYTLEVDKHFSPSKINEVIAEVIEQVQAANLKRTDLDSIMIPYISLIIIKHFTSLDIPNDLDKQLDVLDMLVNGSFLSPIIESLPEEQLQYVFEQIIKVTKKANENMDFLEEKMKELTVENEEMKSNDE